MIRPDLDDSKKDKKPKPNRHKSYCETVTTSGIIVPRDIVNLQGAVSLVALEGSQLALLVAK